MLELANLDLHIISDFDHQLEPQVCIAILTQINLNVHYGRGNFYARCQFFDISVKYGWIVDINDLF